MFSNIDCFNFSAFNGQIILSGSSTANTIRVTWKVWEKYFLTRELNLELIYTNFNILVNCNN